MQQNDDHQPGQGVAAAENAALGALLDLAAARRDSLIAELRQLDRLLMSNGRLKCETLPRRVR